MHLKACVLLYLERGGKSWSHAHGHRKHDFLLLLSFHPFPWFLASITGDFLRASHEARKAHMLSYWPSS